MSREPGAQIELHGEYVLSQAGNQSPSNQGKQVYFQGSRQIDNFSRRYYERELGAGIGPFALDEGTLRLYRALP